MTSFPPFPKRFQNSTFSISLTSGHRRIDLYQGRLPYLGGPLDTKGPPQKIVSSGETFGHLMSFFVRIFQSLDWMCWWFLLPGPEGLREWMVDFRRWHMSRSGVDVATVDTSFFFFTWKVAEESLISTTPSFGARNNVRHLRLPIGSIHTYPHISTQPDSLSKAGLLCFCSYPQQQLKCTYKYWLLYMNRYVHVATPASTCDCPASIQIRWKT